MSGGNVAVVDGLDAAARIELANALARIERGRGLVVRLADMLGGAAMLAGRFGLERFGLAAAARRAATGVAQAALRRAYDVAILGLDRDPLSRRASRGRLMGRAAVAGSGVLGGFAGLAGFLPDATFTTLAIMREVARIAVAEGEDLSGEDARRACLEVFALRGGGGEQEGDEVGYFSARLALQSGPVARLLADVAARYGTVLGEKAGLQAIPLAGAVAGAALNTAFMEHYINLARGHFTIRRLERAYGRDAVRAASGVTNRAADAPFHPA